LCSDVHIREPDFVSAEELVRLSDIIILGAPHKEYAQLDMNGRVLIDVWDFYGRGGKVA